MFKFEIIHKSKKSKARVGKIHTPHGIIDTPNFVAVGTNGAIKALDSKIVDEIGLQLIFCNSYHLTLQPGSELIKLAGGIHKFMSRNLPVITDSGGFQIFSLAYGGVANELKSRGQKKVDGSVLKITDDGVVFRSYRDGKRVFFTPETSVQIQKDIGADIIIPFDELPPYHLNQEALKTSLERTHLWEKRSLDFHLKNRQNQAMYAVLHGGIDLDLRKKSIDFLTKLDFDGFAIGGSIGKNKNEMFEILKFTMQSLFFDKPTHLLGIGDITSLDMAIPLGLDTFDSSYPTKAARHATALVDGGFLKITKAENLKKFEPIEKHCNCYTCRNFTLSYLAHLFKAKELSSFTLLTIHNLYFMVNYMAKIRDRILLDDL